MEKGHRLVKCPGSKVQRCRFTIRLTVTEVDYGKTVTVKCPKCDVEFNTEIPFPAEVPKTQASKDEEFLRKVDEARNELNEALDVFNVFSKKPWVRK